MDEKQATIYELKKQLGSKYRILTIDLERCLYRDFGNGFNVEISGLNTKKRGRKATLYLWYGDEPPVCIIARKVSDVDRTAEAIRDAVDDLYDYSKFLLKYGFDTRRKIFDLKQANGKEDAVMKIYYGTKPKFNDHDKKMFSRGNYECKEILQTRRGYPVVISQSKEKDCPIWKVEHGFSCVVFGTYAEALAYCKGRFCDLDGRTV